MLSSVQRVKKVIVILIMHNLFLIIRYPVKIQENAFLNWWLSCAGTVKTIPVMQDVCKITHILKLLVLV